jgi:16S rRNA (uracil1498-N3)-methyltransferase
MQRRIPAVRAVGDLGHVMSVLSAYEVVIVLSPDGLPLLTVLGESVKTSGSRVLIVAGPEGGLSDEEERLLLGAGCIPAALGPRRLRVETAIVAAVATAGMYGETLPDR